MSHGVAKRSGIYAIETPTGRYYGQSIDLDKRIANHISALRHGRHKNQRLLRAFQKYGEQAVQARIVLEAPPSQLDTIEQLLICPEDWPECAGFLSAEHRSWLLNLASDVRRPLERFADQSRALLSASVKRLWQDADYRARMVAAQKAFAQTPEGRKLAAERADRTRAPEVAQKIAEANRRRVASPEHRALMEEQCWGKFRRAVVLWHADHGVVSFRSRTEAARAAGVTAAAVSHLVYGACQQTRSGWRLAPGVEPLPTPRKPPTPRKRVSCATESTNQTDASGK